MKTSLQFVINPSVNIATTDSLTAIFGGYIYHLSPRVLVWRDFRISTDKAIEVVTSLTGAEATAYNRDAPHGYIVSREYTYNTALFAVDYYDGRRRHFRTFAEVIADKKKHPTAMHFWDPRRKKRFYFVEFSTTDDRKCPCDIR